MSIIETHITIDSNDDSNIESVIAQIQAVLREVNGKDTSINVVDMDNPISTNPLNYRL